MHNVCHFKMFFLYLIWTCHRYVDEGYDFKRSSKSSGIFKGILGIKDNVNTFKKM